MDLILMLSNAVKLILLKLELKMDKKIMKPGILGYKLNVKGLILTTTKWIEYKIFKQYRFKTKWSS